MRQKVNDLHHIIMIQTAATRPPANACARSSRYMHTRAHAFANPPPHTPPRISGGWGSEHTNSISASITAPPPAPRRPRFDAALGGGGAMLIALYKMRSLGSGSGKNIVCTCCAVSPPPRAPAGDALIFFARDSFREMGKVRRGIAVAGNRIDEVAVDASR
jgi:hypothetical protein